VINFYRKMGFRHLSSGQLYEEPSIAEAAISAASLEKFKTSEEAHNNKQFSRFLRLLIKEKLTKDKNCKGLKQCEKYGYSMTYLLNPPPTKANETKESGQKQSQEQQQQQQEKQTSVTKRKLVKTTATKSKNDEIKKKIKVEQSIDTTYINPSNPFGLRQSTLNR